MDIAALMTSPVITVPEETSLAEVARTMLDLRIGCVVVTGADGKIRGIVTESDFAGRERYIPFGTFRAPKLFGEWVSKDAIEQIYATAKTIPVSKIMKSPVITASEDDTVTEVVERMLRHDVNRIPVVRNGIPIGIVARFDLLRLLLDRNGAELPSTDR